jgi:hypothetical protein
MQNAITMWRDPQDGIKKMVDDADATRLSGSSEVRFLSRTVSRSGSKYTGSASPRTRSQRSSRRHLGSAEKRQLLESLIKRHADLSCNATAKMAGVSDKTASAAYGRSARGRKPGSSAAPRTAPTVGNDAVVVPLPIATPRDRKIMERTNTYRELEGSALANRIIEDFCLWADQPWRVLSAFHRTEIVRELHDVAAVIEATLDETDGDGSTNSPVIH